ncbi:MAG: aldehyde dehydrogenase family protein, partial [Porticoccaceae bacterium]
MSQFNMLINGQMVPGASSIEVINPANEEVIAQCPVASQAQLDETVAAANAAFPSWAAKSYAERGALIKQLCGAIADNAEEFAQLLTQEQGKPLAAARDEVMFAQYFANFFAEQTVEPEVLSEDDNQRLEVLRRPLGVVAGICPWNFPLLIT